MRRLSLKAVLIAAVALVGVAIIPAGASALPIPGGPLALGVPDFLGSPATANRLSPGRAIPRNPFMARNGDSNIHDDAYMSDTYRRRGPLGKSTAVNSTFLVRECGSITFDRLGRLVSVCVGLDRPILMLLDPHTLATLASMNLPPRKLDPTKAFTDFSGGGYFYLDHLDRAVIPTTDRHVYVVAETGGIANPGFQRVHDYNIAGAVGADDGIISALPDWHGLIWFASKKGIVGTIDRTTSKVRTYNTHEAIGNSFAIDETGGVYIVTDGALYRFDAARDGTPKVSWRKVYRNTGLLKPGQTERGSGTTPTLMGSRYVSITDNADPMDIVVYRREKHPGARRLVCTQPVFGKGAGDTDNSLIGHGRAMVVENNYGYSGPLATNGGGVTTPGLERVDIDKDGRGCHRVWRSSERAPSVVPKLSLATGLVYIYTKPPDPGGNDVWRLTALSFRSGRTVFSKLAGTGLGYNNNYAPVTLGRDGTAYVGVLGGLVALRDTP